MGTTQPKHAPKPHAMPDSSASWAGTSCSAHSARTASSIGGGPQAYTSHARVAAQFRGEQLGDESPVPDRPVVGGHARTAEERGALGVRGVAEAEQHERGGAERVLPDRQRRDPDAAAGQDRPARLARRREAAAQRAEQPHLVTRAELAQPLGARADVLEQEVERAAGVGAGHGEGPREERALVGAAAPALGGREHVELPRVGRRPAGSATDRTV